MQKQLFYNRKFDVYLAGISNECTRSLSSLPKTCLVTAVHCVLLSLIWQCWMMFVMRSSRDPLTLVRILLPLKLPILLPLPYLQMLPVPLVICTFWILHVQICIYFEKAKTTAAFVPDCLEPIPAPIDELNLASEVAKSFLISKAKLHST